MTMMVGGLAGVRRGTGPQGARGARDGAMGGQRGWTLDPGCPVLPLHRATKGGGGAASP